MRSALRGLVFLACLGPRGAIAGGLDVEIHEVHREEPVVQVIAEVSEEGTHLPDMDVTPDEVIEAFDIQPAEIEEVAQRFEDSGLPFGTVILIDGSHTMHGEKAQVRRAVEGFIRGMGSIDVFSERSSPTVWLGSDPSRVDIVLEHQMVSGHHCNIERCTSGGILVEDAGSAFGTWVEGADIRGRGPVSVKPSQQVHLGLLKTWYTP